MGQVESTSPADGALEMVVALRRALPGPGNVRAAEHLDVLERTLGRLLDEHSGMAEELLCVYEQLGIVFELTRKLATADDEDEAIRLYVESLRTTYPDVWIQAIRPDTSGRLTVCGDSGIPTGWVLRALQQCQDEGGVVVADRPGGAGEHDARDARPVGEGAPEVLPNFSRVLCGCIRAGDDLVRGVLLGRVGPAVPDSQPQVFRASDMSLVDSLNVFCGDIVRKFRLVGQVWQLSVDAVRALISAVDQKDEYTSGHSTRVGVYAVMLGKELGLGHDALQMLEWAALLHDVGKIGIRDEVLKKPGRLEVDEFDHIKEHPVRSNRIVRRIPQLTDALDGVTHHHEHWDGSGYPDGLVGEQIPLQARIIQVADVFDALTSTRSYRKAFDWPKALAILDEEAGRVVDPHICKVFTSMVRRLFRENPQRFQEIASTGRAGLPEGEECVGGDGQARAADFNPRGLKSAARLSDRRERSSLK